MISELESRFFRVNQIEPVRNSATNLLMRRGGYGCE